MRFGEKICTTHYTLYDITQKTCPINQQIISIKQQRYRMSQ